MKKKKKKSNVESILARAEKLFARGNYPLALKEFRKAQKKRPGDDLTEKIAVCQERAGEMKAKEAIKQGRRAEKKGALRAALKHFEEASLTCREEWLGPRIRQLKDRLEGQSAEAEARKAEEAGDFEKAAEFYARAGGNGQSDDLSLKTARALVKAKKYADAADLFDALDVAKPADRYDHGLALAKSGRYVACLETWRKLDARDEQFADQIRAVCRGLAADLFDRFEKREDRAEIVRDATSLLESAGFDAPPAWRRPVENLRQYARYEWIEKLWEAEKFETIAELLESDPPTLLGPRAKTWFNLASADPRRIPTMMLYWMSAVYSHPISSNDRIVKKARQKLVDAAERLIREADGAPDGGRLAARLEIEKKLLSILHDLREKDEHGGESLHGGEVLYTPLFAAHLNKSGEMLALIGKHRSRFPDNEQYLETGAYYSTLGKSLFLMKSGEWDAVEKFLENAPPGTAGNEFDDYAAKRVHFEYGAHCLENGVGGVIHYFDSALELFEKTPELEKRFTEKAIDASGPDALKAYEEVLASIHARGASEAIREALSLVMTYRAIGRFNRDKMGLKALHGALKRALAIHPGNETAQASLKSTLKSMETGKIVDAINRGKLGRASRIARESGIPGVMDNYFEFIEDKFDNIMRSKLTRASKLIRLTDLYEWAGTVDPGRDVVLRLHDYLHTDNEGGADEPL